MIINQQASGGGGVSFLDEIKNQPMLRSVGTIATVTTTQSNYTIFDKKIDPLSPINNINLNDTYDLVAQITRARAIQIKNNGTRLYVLQDVTSHVIHQYNLSVAFDLSSRSYIGSFNYQGTAGADAEGFAISDDGLKMIILNDSSSNVLHEYSLGTAFQISSSTYDSRSFSLNSRDTNMQGFVVSPNGLKLIAVGDQNDRLYEFTLGSAWNLSSVTYVAQQELSSYFSRSASNIRGVTVNGTGDKLVVAYSPSGGGGDYLQQINLSAVGVLGGATAGSEERITGTGTQGLAVGAEIFICSDASTPTILRVFWRSSKSRIFLRSVSFNLVNFVGGLVSVNFWGFKSTINSKVYNQIANNEAIIARFPSTGEASGMNDFLIPQELVAENNLKIEASLNASSNYSNLRYAVNYNLV